jgi:hypothetical protein
LGIESFDKRLEKGFRDSKSLWENPENPESDLKRLSKELLNNLLKKLSKYSLPYYTILLFNTRDPLFLYHKTAIDVMSKRFHLPAPFYLDHQSIYRLRYASLNQNWKYPLQRKR